MEHKLIVSPSPHVHSGDTIEKNMYGVLIALTPAFLVVLYLFRLEALVLTACAVLFCVGFEYLIVKNIIKKEPSILDGSAIITGVLLAFNVPANLPIWILALGCLFAIGVVKLSFGGLGNNIFNPAIAGRLFLLLSFPAQMTTWPVPVSAGEVDAVSTATVLDLLKTSPETLPTMQQMFLGTEAGSMGETSALALLLGLGYLLWRRIITWHIPVSILASVALFSGALYLFNPVPMHHPLIHLLSGGVMLGAIFMATDPVTSPMTKKGMLVYGASIGFIAMAIRLSEAYPEGTSFAILLMNAFTPLINKFITPKRFGKAYTRAKLLQRKEEAH